MTELEETRKVLAETTLRLLRVEKVLDLMITRSNGSHMPTQQDILQINMEAMEELKIYVPWAKWVKEGE